MKRIIWVAALLGGLGVNPALAAGHFYVLASGGLTDADISQQEIDSELTGAGLGLISSSLDSDDTGYKLQLGYQFNPYLALEGGWIDLGKYRYTANLSGGQAQFEAEVDGWNLGVVGMLPLPHQFGLIGKLGVIDAKVKNQISATGTGGSVNESARSKKWKNYWGVGGHYALTPKLGVRLEYEEFHKLGEEDTTGEADVNMWSLGLTYRF